MKNSIKTQAILGIISSIICIVFTIKFLSVNNSKVSSSSIEHESYTNSGKIVHIPVVNISVIKIHTINPGIKVDICKLNITTIDTTKFQSVNIISGSYNEVVEWDAIYDLAFKILGTNKLFIPHPNSPLGFRYKALTKKLNDIGPEWRKDPKLVEAWTAYWTLLKKAIQPR